MVVTIKIEKKMKGEDVFDSSEQMWNKKFASLRLQMEREICHSKLPSLGIYLVVCTPEGRIVRWQDGGMAGWITG